MRRWLVGGALRDRLLGRAVLEHDWLVTGSSEEELLALGYRRVGKDFPVFLHPDSAEEHALPRGGCSDDPLTDITADLRLRDLTINAMAESSDGQFIDPFGGRRDLQQKVLRHVPGFDQDPLRVLRLARLRSQLYPVEFSIAPETLALCRALSQDGQLQRLPPERLWREFEKALNGPAPDLFIGTLRECGALRAILPELDCLFEVPQPPNHHPEGDAGRHSLLSLRRACQLSPSPRVRWASLIHDLGKGLTPRDILPRHIGHETRGVALVEAVCQRLRTPGDYAKLAQQVARYHLLCHKVRELRPATLLKLLLALDALRQPARLDEFLLACQADAEGRGQSEYPPYEASDWLRQALNVLSSLDEAAIARSNGDPARIPEQIRRQRLAALRSWKREQARSPELS